MPGTSGAITIFPFRKKKRGCNHVAVLIQNISSVLHIPAISSVVLRKEPIARGIKQELNVGIISEVNLN
ncbi:MAG: hypothetical protein C5B59_17885 [Bacteroidetes bacterium]|nr:MAG: hypothetical protein C5B59_17885 [Bacteroidota bacterium]